MPTGRLICPKCHSPGMSNYLYYESRFGYNGQYNWLFYNREKMKKKWKCWALLDVCGCPARHWYDPWGLCFNPCDHAGKVVTCENDKELFYVASRIDGILNNYRRKNKVKTL